MFLLENELHLVCSSKNTNLIKNVADLKDETLIFRENGSATGNAMGEYLERNNVTGYKKMILVSNEAVKQSVLAGLGYSIMPKIGLRNEMQLGNIQIVKAPGLPIKTKWNLVSDRQKRLSPAAQALLDFIKETKDEVIKENFN